jgi:hypothetical protein
VRFFSALTTAPGIGTFPNRVLLVALLVVLLAPIAAAVLPMPPLMPTAFATFPGTNGKIATDGITVMNPDGTGVINLTNNLGINTEPVWSADGSKIAFVSSRDYTSSNTEIYVMNADGSNQTRLTHLGIAGRPAWSPDGKKIAFDGPGGLIVMDANGNNQKVLVSENFARPSPDWSPDGRKIAFMSRRDYTSSNWEIYVMNADGTNQTRLTHTGFANYPSWSPDGTKIAFTDYSGEISIINANGAGQISKLMTGVGGVYNAVWPPDGKKFLFEGADSPLTSGSAIYVINSDGSGNLTKIARSHSTNPDWGVKSSAISPSPTLYTLAVNSVDASGRPISGVWTTVQSMDGIPVKSGFTPLTVEGLKEGQYKVTVANYDGKSFSKWQDNSSTSSTRIVTIPVATPSFSNNNNTSTLTAIYNLRGFPGFTPLTYMGAKSQPRLTVNATTLDGNEILHMWIIIDPQIPNTINGTTYKVYATNGYQNLTFDHWGDNGSTDRVRTLTIGQPTTITASYKMQ